jgi:hypothetical protein
MEEVEHDTAGIPVSFATAPGAGYCAFRVGLERLRPPRWGDLKCHSEPVVFLAVGQAIPRFPGFLVAQERDTAPVRAPSTLY